MNIQSVVTALDEDLPDGGETAAAAGDRGTDDSGAGAEDEGVSAVRPEEIVLILHDQGDDGRLFRMPPW